MAAESQRNVDIATALGSAVARLECVSDSPRLDAEILLAHTCGLTRSRIFAHPEQRLTAAELAEFGEATARRAAGEPVAYITGVREFYSLELAVSRKVLVPRPETELLVDVCLGPGLAEAARVVDLGTGSGAIALALKANRPDLKVTAVDRDAAALDVAQSNAATLGLDVRFVRSDWFSALAGLRFDLAVCNPPYVRSTDAHFNGPLCHEPRQALDGGADGLDAYRAVLGEAGAHVAGTGRLIFEHGHDQREALAALAKRRGFQVTGVRDDLAGHSRVMILERRPPVDSAASADSTAGGGGRDS